MDAKTLSAEELAELKRAKAEHAEAYEAWRVEFNLHGKDGNNEPILFASFKKSAEQLAALMITHAPALIAAAERERWIPVAELPAEGIFLFAKAGTTRDPEVWRAQMYRLAHKSPTSFQQDFPPDFTHFKQYSYPPAPGAQT